MAYLLFYSISAIFIFVITYIWDKKNKSIGDASTYEDVEKMAAFNGDFDYRYDGFYVKIKDSRRFIEWNSIIRIITKKQKVVRKIDTVYYIQTENELFEIDYEKPGFYKFIIELEEHFDISPIPEQYYNINGEKIIYEKAIKSI